MTKRTKRKRKPVNEEILPLEEAWARLQETEADAKKAFAALAEMMVALGLTKEEIDDGTDEDS